MSMQPEEPEEEQQQQGFSQWRKDMLYVQKLAEMLMEFIEAEAKGTAAEGEAANAQWGRLFGNKDPGTVHFIALSNMLLRYHEHDHARREETPAVQDSALLTAQDVQVMMEYLTRP